jgi:excisionase family DNA binding protein
MQPMATENAVLLTLHDVADRTSLSYSYVKNLVAKKHIRSVAVGRRRLVHVDDLADWAQALREVAR